MNQFTDDAAFSDKLRAEGSNAMKTVVTVITLLTLAAAPAFAGGAAGGVTCTCKSNLSAVAPKGSPNGGQGGISGNMDTPRPSVATKPKPK